jgi:hypothetical protein
VHFLFPSHSPWLNDKRAAVALIPPSISFSFHPFANIWSAVLKLHSIRFAADEKAHYVAIDYSNVFQVYNDVTSFRLAFKQSLQFGHRLLFDMAAEGEHRELSSRRGLNPERHSLDHFAQIAVAAVPQDCEQCSRISN